MKRIIVCLSLVVALCGFGLAGCAQESPQGKSQGSSQGSSQESAQKSAQESELDIIRNGLAAELGILKNMNDETVNMIANTLPDSTAAEIGSMGLNLQDYLKAYFDGFDYQIGDIKVDGDKAFVDITLKVKNATDVGEALMTYINNLSQEQLIEFANAVNGNGDTPYWFGEGMVQAVSKVPNSVTETLQVRAYKSGNTWSFDEAAGEIIAAAISGV